MFFWIAMCYNLSKSMFVREVKKCLAQKIAIFIVGIISVVSLFACQKANANQSNVSDTEETQKTVLEMEMNANYSNSDPFENGRLFCVSEDIETLDAEVYFQMDGERGIVEIKDRNSDEVLWSNTWDENVNGDTLSVSLNNLQTRKSTLCGLLEQK